MKKCKNCGEPTTFGMFCDYCRGRKERPTSTSTYTSEPFTPGEVIRVPNLSQISIMSQEQQLMNDLLEQRRRQMSGMSGGLFGP